MTVQTPSAESDRLHLLRAVHAAARDAGLDDSDRRALQMRLTGCASCKDMTLDQLKRVAREVRGGGPSSVRSGGPRTRARDSLPSGRHTAMLRALWISAYWLGLIEDRSDRALLSFIRRQTGLDAARFAHDGRDSGRAIEALKLWLARPYRRDGQGGAGVDWSPYLDGRVLPRARVIEAQRRILWGMAPTDRMADPSALRPEEGDEIIRRQGSLIRAPLKARPVKGEAK